MTPWLNRLWQWLFVRPWWVWVTLGLGAVAFLGQYFFSCRIEDCVRRAGLAFQVFGIIVVAKGLRNLRSFPVEWLRQFPFPSFAPQTYVLDLEPASLRISGSDVDLQVVRPPAQALSIEQRLAQLEGRLAEQENLLHQMQTNIVEESRLRKESLQSESRSRESTDQILRTKLEELTTGSLHLELIGFIWIVMGVVLATAAVEIAWLLERLM